MIEATAIEIDPLVLEAQVKTDLVTSVTDQLQITLDVLQAKGTALSAPLEAARIERDAYYSANAAVFAAAQALDNKVAVLQSDPQLNEVNQAIAACARALGTLFANQSK